jgi:PAS domain S-box-containing protein
MGKRLSFETKLLATITSTILLVAALAATTWLAVKYERNQARRLQHTLEVLNSISQIKINLLLPSSIVRSYLISGNEGDLAELARLKSLREGALQKLSVLTADNPVLTENWLQLKEALNARKAIAGNLIQLRRTGGFDAARAYLISEHVGEQQKALFHIFRNMEDEENRLLSERHAELLRASTISIALGSIATASLFILLAMTYLLIRGQMKINLKNQHALELNSTRVATILNTVLDGIITIDRHGVIETMNPAAEKLFGYRADDVVGRNVKILMPEPHQGKHDDYLMRYFETGEKHIIGTGREAHGLRKDGSLFPIELSVNEMTLDGEKHFTGVVHDISSRKKSEQALIAARDEANRANQAKSEFLSNMSHELRTPLNAILGFSQLMEYDETLSADHQDNVREILKAGAHLLVLINEVLDLAKVESGRVELSMEPVEICHLIAECLSLVHCLADKRGVRLSHKELEGMTVRADYIRLKQALLNLISNAIKYNREGGSVHIEVLAMSPDRLRIMVEDTGPGIAPSRIAELFQPFNRLDAENSGIEGTGIGLTITRRIVEMMGGSVGVKSEIGQGSTFWIELPPESLSNAAPERLDKLTGNPASFSEGKRILYIEDNPANLKLVTQILGRHAHIQLLTANCPEQGIELALSHKPDLILLDINMPNLDGYQVMEILKSDDSLADIPVIAVTAHAMERDFQRGKAAGFADYLTKPLDIAPFLETVERCLAGTQSVV